MVSSNSTGLCKNSMEDHLYNSSMSIASSILSCVNEELKDSQVAESQISALVEAPITVMSFVR